MIELSADALLRAAFESPSPRPVANASFALNYWLGGYALAGLHAVNIALHAAASFAVYLLARRTLELAGVEVRRREPAALFAAAIFAAHPIQTQAVTYLVQRMTSMAALFYLLALLAFLAGRVRRGGARLGCYALAVCAGGLSLGSKQTAATLPFAVLLYEFAFFRDLDWRWLLRWVAVPALLLAGLAAIYLGADLASGVLASYAHRDFTLGERLLTQPRVVVFYASLLLWPWPTRLNLLHTFEPSRSLLDPTSTALAALLLVAVAAAALVTWRRSPLAGFCAAWFFLTLAVESTVLPLELAYEHRLYLPMFGVALLASHVAVARCAGPTPLRVGLAIALVAALGAGTWARNELWRDPIAFWRDVVEKSPERARPRNNLGLALFRDGRVEAAVEAYRAGIRLDPDYAQTHANLGVALAQRGDYAAAERAYREAVRLDPLFARAHNNLGLAVARQGRVAEANRHFQRAVQIDRNLAEAYNNLGVSYRDLGQRARALQSFRQAVRLDPSDPIARQNLEELLRRP